MSVAARAEERGIREVLHYTSERGVMGAIRKGKLLSRQRVEADEDLAFVFQGIWPRKDPEWVDHISMSLSRINLDLFRRSRRRFPQWWWGVLSFKTGILDHDDVVFTTTNNIYPPCQRGKGLAGFEAMFADEVEWGYRGSVIPRSGHPDHFTTDRAAEVLYPGELSLTELEAIYVPGDQHRRLVRAWCEVFDWPVPTVEVRPEAFT